MKRILLIILISFFLTGCTIVRINTDSIDTIVNVILSKDNNLYNRVGRGYKYYIPRGVSYIDTNETNEKLYSKGNYYYLYVDVISYSKKISNDFKSDEDLFYSKKFSKEDGYSSDGYLKITKKDNLYYIEFVYNCATIETMVSEKNINDAVLNSAYILSTIQFNDDVIDLMIDDEKIGNREEKYELFKNKQTEKNDNLELQVEDK